MRSFVQRAALVGLLIASCVCAFGQQDAAAPIAHPATSAQIEKLMALTHATDAVKTAIHGQIEIQKKQGPQIFPDGFWSDCEVEFAKIDWVKIATPIYQRYFSEAEADAVITFYSTPVGQKVLESSRVISHELSSQGYALGSEIGKRVAERYQDEIAAKMKKLQQQHDAAPAPQ